jgi:hypothetical protein
MSDNASNYKIEFSSSPYLPFTLYYKRKRNGYFFGDSYEWVELSRFETIEEAKEKLKYYQNISLPIYHVY